jgi:hypothetical protein
MTMLFGMVACGGGSSDEQDAAALSALVAQFEGLTVLEKSEDNSWVLRWTPIDEKGVVYAVFSAKEGEEFNYNQPLETTQEDIFKYVPKNVFEETATCFIVRISNLNGDENTTSKCTTDTPFVFTGLQTMERQNDGAYLLTWDEIPVEGTIYAVYESVENEYNFELPSFDAIKDNFFKTRIIDRSETLCFIVRYFHTELPEDLNTTELCTEEEKAIDFGGITNLNADSSTKVVVTWNKSSTEGISEYAIYQGSDFKEQMGTSPASKSNFEISGLVPGRQYSFGVRAIDAFGREDKNLKIRSIVMPTN